MKKIGQGDALHTPDFSQMLHSIDAEYNFLTPASRHRLSIAIEMIWREARRLADQEQTEIATVLEEKNVILR